MACTCSKCMEIINRQLIEAREKWKNGEREISFKPYHYQCGDGCCDEYGTRLYINGYELNCDGENPESVARSLLEFLEVDNFNLDWEYED